MIFHVSGADNFVDNSETGVFIANDHPFNDANPDEVRTITAAFEPNGAVDEVLFKAVASGDVNVYFVSPGGVYGHSE